MLLDLDERGVPSLKTAGYVLPHTKSKFEKEEIKNIYRGNPRTRRRYLTATIVEAEAYAASNQVEVGVEYAIDALGVANEMQTPLHIARINSLYTSLREHDKYKKSADVARLGLELLKVQKPALFR